MDDTKLIILDANHVKNHIITTQDYFFWRGFWVGTAYGVGATLAIYFAYTGTVRDMGRGNKLASVAAALTGVYKAIVA
jgi:hypothetical protein